MTPPAKSSIGGDFCSQGTHTTETNETDRRWPDSEQGKYRKGWCSGKGDGAYSMQQPYRQQGRAGQFNGKLPLPGQVSHEQHRSPLGRVLAWCRFQRTWGSGPTKCSVTVSSAGNRIDLDIHVPVRNTYYNNRTTYMHDTTGVVVVSTLLE
jgi:hypothetical protein